MLPASGEILKKDFQVKKQPTKTFYMDFKTNRIVGTVDGIEAMKQAVAAILDTERFEWLIYSWRYGIEKKRLIGKPASLMKAKMKKRIREALMQDDRVRSVNAFSFTEIDRRLLVSFQVDTVFGEIMAEKEVDMDV